MSQRYSGQYRDRSLMEQASSPEWGLNLHHHSEHDRGDISHWWERESWSFINTLGDNWKVTCGRMIYSPVVLCSQGLNTDNRTLNLRKVCYNLGMLNAEAINDGGEGQSHSIAVKASVLRYPEACRSDPWEQSKELRCGQLWPRNKTKQN